MDTLYRQYSTPWPARRQVLERLSVGEGSFVRTMADSAGFGNLVAQVPRMLLELTNGPVSVISTSGSLLPPEEYAKLECALPGRVTLPRRTPPLLTLHLFYEPCAARTSVQSLSDSVERPLLSIQLLVCVVAGAGASTSCDTCPSTSPTTRGARRTRCCTS